MFGFYFINGLKPIPIELFALINYIVLNLEMV